MPKQTNDKSAKEVSMLFHNIMKASVKETPKPKDKKKAVKPKGK